MAFDGQKLGSKVGEMTALFDVDVKAQARALLKFDGAPISWGLYPLVGRQHDRIILTGMGGSHYAGLPSWRRLVSRGRATWWLDAGQLLESPELVTPDSLLVVTSRSGKGGEVLALVEKFDDASRPAVIVAITDNLDSPLAEAADCEILLRSQSSGSAKGFLNTLAAHDYLTSMILSEDNDDVGSTARVVSGVRYSEGLDEVAHKVAANPQMRLVYIGFREHAAAALYASLLTKEVTRIAAESYIAGPFRHGPLHMADGNLTAMVFGGRDPIANAASRRLAAELVAAGSTVVVVGDAGVDGALDIRSPAVHVSGQLAHAVMVAEHFVSALATQSVQRPNRR
jgi:fructoselysine-6-P-deglycase FrlB-like protein